MNRNIFSCSENVLVKQNALYKVKMLWLCVSKNVLVRRVGNMEIRLKKAPLYRIALSVCYLLIMAECHGAWIFTLWG